MGKIRNKYYISTNSCNTNGNWLKICEEDYKQNIAYYKDRKEFLDKELENYEEDYESEDTQPLTFRIEEQIVDYTDRIESYFFVHDENTTIILKKVECKEGYYFATKKNRQKSKLGGDYYDI